MSEFVASHVRCTGTIHLEQSPDAVFPLFGPIRESEWAAEWSITVMHSTSPLLDEEGAVFTTHLHGDHPTIWVVTRFDAGTRTIQYARITPDVQAVIIDIACQQSEDGNTDAAVSYTLTGLSKAGNQRITAFAANYDAMMRHWERAINHRLRTGEVLAHL